MACTLPDRGLSFASISHSIRWVGSGLPIEGRPDWRQSPAGYALISVIPISSLPNSNSAFPERSARVRSYSCRSRQHGELLHTGGQVHHNSSRVSDQAVDLIPQRLEDECPPRQIVGPSGDAADGLRNLEVWASRQDKPSLSHFDNLTLPRIIILHFAPLHRYVGDITALALRPLSAVRLLLRQTVPRPMPRHIHLHRIH